MYEKINNWASEIIEYCNPIAKEENLEYYSLQSPINLLSSDILIIGVNPRSSGNHFSQSENKKWEFQNGRMTKERLLAGNPYFLNDKTWRFFNNLKQIDFLKSIIEKGNYTYMNYFYFSTKNAGEMKKIKNFEEIVEFCVRKLKELIEILKPKVVIVLGVKDGLDIIIKNSSQTLISKSNKRILTTGLLDGKKIYAIPHSSRNFSFDTRDVISENLSEIYNNKDIVPIKIMGMTSKKITKNCLNIKLINEKLKEFDFNFVEYNGKKDMFKAVYNKGINNDVLEFRIDSNKNYFSFRSIEKINNSFFELKGKEIYKKLFAVNAELEKGSWLVHKSFKNYNSEKSIEEQISNDLEVLFETIKNN